MRTKLLIGVLSAVVGIGLGLAGTAEPVAAHHAFAAEFDAERPVEFSGKVTRVEWVNPHVWIHIDVELDDGTTEVWAFEGGTPNVLFRRGFTRRSPPARDRRPRRRLPGEGRHEPAPTAATSRSPTGRGCSSGRRAPAPPTSWRGPASDTVAPPPVGAPFGVVPNAAALSALAHGLVVAGPCARAGGRWLASSPNGGGRPRGQRTPGHSRATRGESQSG